MYAFSFPYGGHTTQVTFARVALQGTHTNGEKGALKEREREE